MFQEGFLFYQIFSILFRYLVGLRWWTEHLADGKEKWMFECRPDESKINKGDSRVFWSGQIIYFLGGIGLIVLSVFFSSYSMVLKTFENYNIFELFLDYPSFILCGSSRI